MSEYIEMLKDEIFVIDEELKKIEIAFKNDKLEDYQIQLLEEAKNMFNARLIYCEKVIIRRCRKDKKDNLIKTINLKQ